MTDSEFEVLDLSRLSPREFFPLVSSWANAFDEQYRTLLYVTATLTDLKTSIARAPAETLKKRMQAAYKAQGAEASAPSTKTIYRRFSTLRNLGVLRTYQPRTAKEWSTRPEFKSNRFEFDFLHVVVDGKVSAHDFLNPPSLPVSDGLNATVSHALGTVQSSFHKMTDGPIGDYIAGASPRTPEEHQDAWFAAFASDLSELLDGRKVTVATVRKHCSELTDYSYSQTVRPALESWFNRKSEYVLGAGNPVAYAIASFPEAFYDEHRHLCDMSDRVITKGQEVGLLEVRPQTDVVLLDDDERVVDEWSWDEFEHLTDDPTNLYRLWDYFAEARPSN